MGGSPSPCPSPARGEGTLEFWFVTLDRPIILAASSGVPSPLAGEGQGEGVSRVKTLSFLIKHPSSAPSGHLLPQGEKGNARDRLSDP
jgi:hypothetical protein